MRSDIAVAMRVLSGTSGFSYKEWVGAFYPEKTAAKGMLGYYATRLPIVEINNTFYRMPNAEAVGAWRAQVPDSFRFAIKAPRRITHVKRLKDCEAELGFLFTALAALEPCLGSILFQLPPFAKVDVAALSSFVEHLPPSCRAAFEFRNASWLTPDVYAVLKARNLALVHSESEEPLGGDLPWTADWAYLRLRRVVYTPADLDVWLARLRAANLRETHVFFKHEDQATGPLLAEQFQRLADSA
jgi:uncharacterized protein YecE (DUF72 family)